MFLIVLQISNRLGSARARILELRKPLIASAGLGLSPKWGRIENLNARKIVRVELRNRPDSDRYLPSWNQTVIVGSIRISPRICSWILPTSNRWNACCRNSFSVRWNALRLLASRSGWLIKETSAPFVPKDRNAPTKPAACTWLLAAAIPSPVLERVFRVSLIPTRGCHWDWAWLARWRRQVSS